MIQRSNLFFICMGLFFAAASAASAVTVNVSSPTNNYSGTSPVHVAATATSDQNITGWVVYVDGQVAYQASSSSIDTQLNVAEGGHQLVVRAWDSNGKWGDVWETITVNGNNNNNGLPTPPTWAKVFSNVHTGGSWGSCHDPGCAGGSGKGTYWMAQNQGSPSLTGRSTEFYNSGVWANALYWHPLGANSSQRNFLIDYYLYVDNPSKGAAQSYEQEAYQFVSGWNYMMGTQCDVGSGVWDTWDMATNHWYGTSVPCHNFTPNTWHHIQWYITTDTNAKKYTYHVLVVDGQSYTLNTTRNAARTGWGDNVGIQWQIDVNASGTGYHEWIDKGILTIW
jgi:hypothetical protein